MEEDDAYIDDIFDSKEEEIKVTEENGRNNDS